MSESRHPFMIQHYGGYYGSSRILVKGRVLENENFLEQPSDSKVANLLDSFRRFESDEIEGAKVLIEVKGQEWELITDDEGYFVLDVELEPIFDNSSEAIMASVKLLEPKASQPLMVEKKLYTVHHSAKFGVISDIDDTVLQTHMNAGQRLKMIYVSFLQGAHQRLPMEGIVDLFQDLQGTEQEPNPFFYVSNSPWNIHSVLTDFIELQKLPAGPVLLRDFGLHLVLDRKTNKAHKLASIKHILETYPKLPFVLFGDTASSDADYYLQFKNEFPDQIRAVYIRHTVDTKNARRVKELIASTEDPNFVLIESSKEIREHAEMMGLIEKKLSD